jgi:hypothetical protein
MPYVHKGITGYDDDDDDDDDNTDKYIHCQISDQVLSYFE